MNKVNCLLIFLLGSSPVFAQFTVASGTNIAANDGTDVVIAIKGNVNNGGSYDFSNANLRLTLQMNTTAQTISGNLTAHSLNLFSGQNTTVNGNLTVTNEMYFNTGDLIPGNSGKILYTGVADNINGDESNSFDDSFVDGKFYVLHSGRNFFPIGAASIGFAPAYIDGNGKEEIAFEVFDEDAGLTFDPSGDIGEIDPTRYWQITTGDLAAIDAKVTLHSTGVVLTNQDLGLVVVQADNTGGEAENLLSVLNDADITSRRSVTKPILAIGGSREVELVIHDIMTPFSPGENDYLVIDNIEKFTANKVTLLDRWGGKVHEWTNFTNYGPPFLNPDGYDFKTLSPGNYICIVEYGDPDVGFSKKSQMVTVLKVK
jgi:CHU_C Type IX secretion signal domain